MADDPLLDVVARTLHEPPGESPFLAWDQLAESLREAYRRTARALLAAIAETRRLLPAGGAVVVATTEAGQGFTERVEWGSLDHGEVVTWGIGGEKQARANAKWLRETDPDAKVMRRNIYVGPWEEAP